MSAPQRCSLAELATQLGREVAVSPWFTIDQARVDAFAEATLDRQWIHVDPERARRESPYREPIAHGYLSLALLPYLTECSLELSDVRMAVNYGLNRVRFPAPVPVDSRIRAHFLLAALTAIDGGVQAQWQITVEREGSDKPVCVAESLARYYAA